jgi:hypothetical protein
MRRSAPAVAYLATLPRAVPFVLVIILLALGVFAPAPIAFVALLVMALLMAWLLLLTWSVLSRPGRVLRLLATVIVLGFAVARLAG